MYKISEVLEDLIEENNVNIEHLSSFLNDKDSSKIRDWLNKSGNPRLNDLIKLAEYFQCSLDYLLGRTQEYKKAKFKEAEKFDIQLEKIMKDKNITQYRMVNDKICTYGHFAKWKKLKAEPQVNTLIKLADYFGVTVDYLLGRE